MTPRRQWAHALWVVAVSLAVALPAFADVGSEGRDVIGPPTAEEVAAVQAAAVQAAADAEAAKVAAAAAVLAPKQVVPAWLAARPTPKPVATKSSMPSTGRLIGLLLVVGSLGGAALYLKRRGRGEVKAAAKPQRLSVLSSTKIGPRAHAVVISVAGRQMLLGVTDSSVKRLAFIDDLVEDDERDREREPARRAPLHSTTHLAAQAVRAAAPEPAQSRSFATLLKTAFSKREPAAEPDAASILAAETQDVVGDVGGGGRLMTSNVRMLDVEGQAQGLVRRLSGPRA